MAGDDWHTVTPDPAVDEFVTAPGEPCWLATVETWPKSYRLTDGSMMKVSQMPTTYTDQVVEMDAAAAGHITRNDPAHVLRTVAAHRAILDRHTGQYVWFERENGRITAQHVVEICTRCLSPTVSVFAPPPREPCPEILSLLSIYEDRPGFDPSWRPE